MGDRIGTHTHVLEDGTVIEHTHVEEAKHEHEIQHGHTHSHGGHGHTHTHQNTKAVLNRLSRAIGHLESIRRMVEDGRDCTEVLIQLSAVKSAINNTGKVILQDHIEHCIVDAVREGDAQALEELNRAIDRFMK
ncbi:MAG: metal-sensing transcriptional repressor [Clostridiales bacterium]|nr:metal-sensing transcriptional repressor [Clostridiales bacterium]